MGEKWSEVYDRLGFLIAQLVSGDNRVVPPSVIAQLVYTWMDANSIPKDLQELQNFADKK